MNIEPIVMTPTFDFSLPSTVKFGAGASIRIGQIAKMLKLKTVLCIYDEGILRSGISQKIISFLEQEDTKVVSYEGVTPNPTEQVVEEATVIARENNVDGIIAIGGGSSIDCAKAVNILLTNPGTIHQYEGRDKVYNQTKPLIAIPTTAGTGSEVTAVTVVTDSINQRKMIISGQNCGATIALLDPSLTVGLPVSVTVGTGMDALTHAIEAYLSKGGSVITDLNALKAVSLLSENIYEAVVNGTNLEARSNMLLGSLLAGFAFNSAGLGLVHAISHPISSHCHVPHGIANAILLPYVVEFNGEEREVQRKIYDLAPRMGIEISNHSEVEIVDRFVVKLKELSKKLNVPRLSEMGVEEELFNTIAKDALEERSMTFTPKKANKTDIIHILRKAY